MKVGDLVVRTPTCRPLGVGIVLVANGRYVRSQVYIDGRKLWLNVDTLEVIYEGR